MLQARSEPWCCKHGLSPGVASGLSPGVAPACMQGRIRDGDWRPGLRKSYWELGWVAMQSGSSSVQSSSTRIMLLAYGAMAVVLLNCYVAALTTSLTVNRWGLEADLLGCVPLPLLHGCQVLAYASLAWDCYCFVAVHLSPLLPSLGGACSRPSALRGQQLPCLCNSHPGCGTH